MVHQLDPVELRVLGCLIEKQRTTPDAVPALAERAAARVQPGDEPRSRRRLRRGDGARRRCSGSAARLDTARERARLAARRSTATCSTRRSDCSPSRDCPARGADAARPADGRGELQAAQRAAASFASVPDVESTLERLAERELVQRQERRPGTREERWTHLLGETSEPQVERAEPAATTSLEDRLARIEARLSELERALAPHDPDEGRS